MIGIIQIDALLQQEDIEGLLALGAPRDEYIFEAKSIAAELVDPENRSTEDQIYEVIKKVWNRKFGPFESADLEKRSMAFRRVAQMIIRHQS